MHRVQTFRSEAKNIEEVQAWDKVELWMRTLIGESHRKLNRNGAIAIDCKAEPEKLTEYVCRYCGSVSLLPFNECPVCRIEMEA